jgi:cysteine desulfurase/selenocysteine lyase
MLSSLIPRTEYASLAEGVYLNQASLGLLAQPVVRAMHDFLDEVARHGNLHMTDADEASFFETLRGRAARLFRVNGDRIAIISSASELLGQIPLLIPPGGDRKILAIASDFPAVTRPWLRLAANDKCTVQFIEDHPERDLTGDLLAALDDQTAVIAVGSVQYATGSRVDVPRLQRAARESGARLVIDATQGAGALAMDAAAWDADLVVSSGYKWLGGHGGVALAVMGASLLERTPPLPGWMGAPDPFAFDATQLLLADGARRYTQSTMSYVSLAGLTAALDQLLALSEARIEAHARGLAQMLVENAGKQGWQPFRDLSDPAASPHIISLTRPGKDLGETPDALRRANIVCSARGGRIRVSLAPYNDESDIESLVAVLR